MSSSELGTLDLLILQKKAELAGVNKTIRDKIGLDGRVANTIYNLLTFGFDRYKNPAQRALEAQIKNLEQSRIALTRSNKSH